MARTYGLALLCWAPTAGGLLTGRYRRGEPVPEDSRYDRFWGRGHDQLFTEAAFDVVYVVAELAAQHDCTPAQVALAWCVAQPGVTAALLGPRTPEQLADSLSALDITLSADNSARLDAVAPPYGMTVPFYGHDGFAWIPWGPHEQRWV